MSAITKNTFIQPQFAISGALVATSAGNGTADITFTALANVAQSRIKNVIVGNTTYRLSGSNPEISSYNSTTGTFTCVDVIENGLPCIVFYTPI